LSKILYLETDFLRGLGCGSEMKDAPLTENEDKCDFSKNVVYWKGFVDGGNPFLDG
jgi:hypothetical protein